MVQKPRDLFAYLSENNQSRFLLINEFKDKETIGIKAHVLDTKRWLEELRQRKSETKKLT